LLDRGPYYTLALSPEHQRTLAMLYQVVMKRGDVFHQVRDLVSELISRLPADEQRKAVAYASAIDIKLEQFIGDGIVDNKVWSIVARAIQEKRKLAFQYLPPQAVDQDLWYVEVAPIKIQFRIGNWYLQAYELLRRYPNNRVELDSGYQRYPLTRIQSDDKLTALPNVMAGGLRKLPSLQVSYRLSPSASSEAIRPYFDKMETTRNPDGSYEITAVTDDIQEAARLLAGYAEDCTVLGGPELRSEFEKMVRKMAENYGMNA
jgi:predicted DNA-binding transcriptional regulator YafY